MCKSISFLADVNPVLQVNAQDDSADEDEPNVAVQASEEGTAETASSVINLAVHPDCQCKHNIGRAGPVHTGPHRRLHTSRHLVARSPEFVPSWHSV